MANPERSAERHADGRRHDRDTERARDAVDEFASASPDPPAAASTSRGDGRHTIVRASPPSSSACQLAASGDTGTTNPTSRLAIRGSQGSAQEDGGPGGSRGQLASRQLVTRAWQFGVDRHTVMVPGRCR